MICPRVSVDFIKKNDTVDDGQINHTFTYIFLPLLGWSSCSIHNNSSFGQFCRLSNESSSLDSNESAFFFPLTFPVFRSIETSVAESAVVYREMISCLFSIQLIQDCHIGGFYFPSYFMFFFFGNLK